MTAAVEMEEASRAALRPWASASQPNTELPMAYLIGGRQMAGREAGRHTSGHSDEYRRASCRGNACVGVWVGGKDCYAGVCIAIPKHPIVSACGCRVVHDGGGGEVCSHITNS